VSRRSCRAWCRAGPSSCGRPRDRGLRAPRNHSRTCRARRPPRARPSRRQGRRPWFREARRARGPAARRRRPRPGGPSPAWWGRWRDSLQPARPDAGSPDGCRSSYPRAFLPSAYTGNLYSDVRVMHSAEERIRANAADPLNCGQDRRIFVQRNFGGNAQCTRHMFNGLSLLRHALGRRVGRQGDPAVA